MDLKNVRIGSLLWVSSVQYYVVQLAVAAAWQKTDGYSWGHNTISDLANTHCGAYGNRLVCSPLHGAMNLSFILLGLTMIGGAVLLGRQLANTRILQAGFACMMASGLGTILIGLFPENTVGAAHIAGATLAFALGNLGMILIGWRSVRFAGWLRLYGVLSGLVGLIALALFLEQTYLGLSIGGMERVVAYPQSVWMIITGAYLLLAKRSLSTGPV